MENAHYDIKDVRPKSYGGFDVFWSDDVIWSNCMFDPKDVRESH